MVNIYSSFKVYILYLLTYVMKNTLLEVTEVKHLDVCFDLLLLFDKHICEKN